VILRVYRLFLGNHSINPNVLTMCGTTLGAAACFAITFDRLFLGGLLLFLSGFLDIMDGAVARNTGRVTGFGGFLDSVLDRYTDLLVLFGVLVHFLNRGEVMSVFATFVAAMGTAIIPYAKARAEAASIDCNNGLLERPERLIILLVGLFFGVLLPYCILLLAVFTHVTVVQRIMHVKKRTQLRSGQI